MKTYDDWKCTPPDEGEGPREYVCVECGTHVHYDEECPQCEAAYDRANEWDACDDADAREMEAVEWD